VELEKDRQDRKADSNFMNRRDVTMQRNDEVMIPEDCFRTSFSPEAVSARRDSQSIVSPVTSSVKLGTSVKRRKGSEQLSASELNRSRSIKPTDHDNMEEIRQIQDILQSAEPKDVQITSKQSEVIEILDIPESSVANPHKISLSKETRAISIDPSPRPKSAPTQRSRASYSSTPLSTRTSGKKSKKRDYPSMKLFTEDGTDGINPRTPSPVEPDDGGCLVAMLEGPPPEAPGIAAPICLPDRKQSPTTLTAPVLTKSTSTAGRVREFVEIKSDSGNGEIPTPIERTQKRQKVESEPRRQLLSPDLALKNKGRGRYSTSFLKR